MPSDTGDHTGADSSDVHTVLRPDHRAGDVVLMRNDSQEGIAPILTALITKLDRSPFSHSGLMIGLDEMSHIGRKGSELTTLSQRTSPTSSYGLVVSFEALDLDDETAALVIAEGRRLGTAEIEYSEIQLVLAGFMLRYRAIPWYLRWTVPLVLPALAVLINRAVDEGRELMICSDYVYRCFDVAGHELLPGGLPDLSAVDSATPDGWTTVDAWLADRVSSTHSVDPTPLDAPTTLDELGSALADGDPFAVLDDPRHDVEPALDEHTAGEEHPGHLGDPAEIAAAVDAFDRALADARGPSPSGTAASQFITPGDLWRSPRLCERARWTADDRA